MIYAGIDPGLSGALAWILPGGTWEGADAPTKQHGAKRETDPREMARLLAPLGTQGQPGRGVHVMLEDVRARPGQGVVSMFSFGRGFGQWEGAVRGLGYSLDRVAPASWKRAMLHGMPPGKHSSIVLCERLFPGCGDWLRGSRGAELDGRAEALLLAEFGRRTHRLQGEK